MSQNEPTAPMDTCKPEQTERRAPRLLQEAAKGLGRRNLAAKSFVSDVFLSQRIIQAILMVNRHAPLALGVLGTERVKCLLVH